MSKFSVMFVCLGNICRSPIAEGVFRQLALDRGFADNFRVESSGTGSWHVGEPAHVESLKVAAKHGISLEGHRAQQLAKKHFDEFDLLVAMDRENHRTIQGRATKAGVRLSCLREFDPEGSDLDVPDPYYLPNDAFQEVFNIIQRSCRELLSELEKELSL